MASIKERFEKWKSRKLHQKIGDVFFWIFLIILIIPGPRKVVATSVNKVFLHLRHPSIASGNSSITLGADEYNWGVRNEAGEFLSSESLKGEVIFLNFWATWCPPCVAELPEIEGIAEQYSDRVKFILVTNEEQQKVEAFLNERGYDFPVHYGGNTFPVSLRPRSFPTTYIIARDGTIVNKTTGAADWNSKATRKVLDKLLAQEVLR